MNSESYRHRIWYLFLIISIFSLIQEADAQPIEKQKIEGYANYTELEFYLNEDGSVDYTATVRMSFDTENPCIDCIVTSGMKLNDKELIDYESITIVDFNNPEQKFNRVDKLNVNCIGTYSFNYENKDIDICLRNSVPNNIAFKISYTYEPMSDIEISSNQGLILRKLTFNLKTEKFPQILRTTFNLSPKLIPLWGDEKCGINKTPIKMGKSLVCELKREEAIEFANGNNTITMDIMFKGELRDYQEADALKKAEIKEKVILTAKAMIGAILFIIGFFGVLRTKLMNKAYTILRGKNMRLQLLLCAIIATALFVYIFTMIWWDGQPVADLLYNWTYNRK